jgi:hypothetical protein
MKTEEEAQGDLEEASERILVQCKKDILSAVRTATDERGEPVDQDGRMFILATFLHGYVLAIAELTGLLKMPLLPLLADVVCSVARDRNLEGLEESIHQLLHRLDHSLPDGDLNRVGNELLDSAFAKVLGKNVQDHFGMELPKPKKGDFSVN